MYTKVTDDRIEIAFREIMGMPIGTVISYESLVTNYNMTRRHRVTRLRRMLGESGRLTEAVTNVGFKIVGSDRALVHLSSSLSSASRKLRRGIKSVGAVDASDLPVSDQNRLTESLLKVGNVAAVAHESQKRVRKLLGGEEASVDKSKLLSSWK